MTILERERERERERGKDGQTRTNKKKYDTTKLHRVTDDRTTQ